MPRTLLLALLLLSSLPGCGGRSSTPLDATTGLDAAVTDAGGSDAGRDAGGLDAAVDASAAPDSGGPDATVDASAGPDSGPAPDAGLGPDATVCDEGLGAMCEEAPCPSGLECSVGRCVPQGRPICGGFAGATCDDPRYPYCLYFSSADFGPCVTPGEASCLCARAPGSFASCP